MSGGIWIAAYAEWSNRTRHVLRLANDLPQPVPLILLGRPRKSARRFLSLLRQHLGEVEFELVRPLRFTAFLQALPKILRVCREVTSDAHERGYKLPLRILVAIFYRLQLGCVHQCWWRRSGYAPEIVVYGHTGKADTSLLECEQQKAGTRTVHVLHGFSNGLGFTGISDVAIAKCQHDAEWHKRLGGYGESIVIPAARPRLEPPRRGWALLTNYAHPMASSIDTGVDREQQALRIVAEAARQLGVGAEEIIYRPHPALSSLDRQHQSAVSAAACDCGIRLWPKDLQLSRLHEFELVITTPSTAIQDTLLAGTVPVLLDLATIGNSTVYTAYPLRARSKSELVAVLREVRADRAKAFEQAWEAIGPGVNPSLDQIEAAVTRSGGS